MEAIKGVVRVGEVPNTSDPLPVSSDTTQASCEEVVDANCERFPDLSHFNARSVLSAIVPSRSWKVYVLESVFEFVKKLVKVLATFLKFILKRVRPAYPPVASFPEVSCLSVFRLEKFVLVCVRNEFAVIQSFKVVIELICLRDYSSRPVSRCKSGNVSGIIPEFTSLIPSAKIVPYTCYNR